jgi:hypothetical protein
MRELCGLQLCDGTSHAWLHVIDAKNVIAVHCFRLLGVHGINLFFSFFLHFLSSIRPI